MHGRVLYRSMPGLYDQRRVVMFLLVLVGNLLCFGLTAQAKSNYEVINTGIKGGGCWYDDSHFIIVKGQQPAPGQEFEMEGLYYVDPAKPKDLNRIDLSPLEPSLQKHIRDVTCQEETILFHILTADRTRNQLYTLKLGRPPLLLAEKPKGFVIPRAVNVKNQYVLGFSSTLKERGLESSATPEAAKTDCPFTYIRPPYRVVCLRHDRGTKQTWLVNNTFLTKYIWDETIRVGQEGAYTWVPNPEPPLKLPDGTELKQGYLLRDLENRIVQEILTKQGTYRIDEIKANPGGSYLYATCSKEGDYNPHRTFYGRICRLKLGGTQQQWDEVFSLQKEPNEQASLYDFDVNDQGDVVVIRRANRTSPTIWRYIARRARVEQLPTGQLSQEIGVVWLTPDGQTISYVDKGQRTFVRSQGGKS
ncbi:MAG: hypothetical protein AB7P24_01655 [Nitrospira sp.]